MRLSTWTVTLFTAISLLTLGCRHPLALQLSNISPLTTFHIDDPRLSRSFVMGGEISLREDLAKRLELPSLDRTLTLPMPPRPWVVWEALNRNKLRLTEEGIVDDFAVIRVSFVRISGGVALKPFSINAGTVVQSLRWMVPATGGIKIHSGSTLSFFEPIVSTDSGTTLSQRRSTISTGVDLELTYERLTMAEVVVKGQLRVSSQIGTGLDLADNTLPFETPLSCLGLQSVQVGELIAFNASVAASLSEFLSAPVAAGDRLSVVISAE